TPELDRNEAVTAACATSATTPKPTASAAAATRATVARRTGRPSVKCLDELSCFIVPPCFWLCIDQQLDAQAPAPGFAPWTPPGLFRHEKGPLPGAFPHRSLEPQKQFDCSVSAASGTMV